MLTNPPVPYDLCIRFPILHLSRGLLRDGEVFANLRLTFISSSTLLSRLSAGAQLRRYRLLCRPRALARIRRQRAEVQRARRPGAVVERGHAAALRRAHGVPGAAVRRHARGGPQCQREVWPGYGSNAARPASTPRTHQIDARHALYDVTTFRGTQYSEKEEPTSSTSAFS